jgi:uncharacterized protein (TIGR02246 family)
VYRGEAILTPAQTAQRLVACINSHDAAAVAALLTPDHRFIDSLGAEVRGRDALQNGWRQYFSMVPDYQIEVDRVLVDGQQVVLLGVARGTYTTDGSLNPENAWSMPGAWRALIRDGLVAEWQVYADNEPIRRCMVRASV